MSYCPQTIIISLNRVQQQQQTRVSSCKKGSSRCHSQPSIFFASHNQETEL